MFMFMRLFWITYFRKIQTKNCLAKKMTHGWDIVRENCILGLISRFIYLKELKVSKSRFKIGCFVI